MNKTYLQSEYELELLRVLTDMAAKGIHSLKALQEEGNAQVYTTLWFAMEKFVNHVALRTKNHKIADNKYCDGNAARLRELLEMGCDPEDLRSRVLLQIMTKMDHVLVDQEQNQLRPVSKQIPYCVTITSNCLVDEYRERCPGGRQMESLSEPVGQQEDGEYTIEDTLSEMTSAEDWVMAGETVRERMEAQRAQSRREILEDLSQLRSGNQVFVYLCMYERMKPAHIFAAVEQLAAKNCTPQEIAELTVEKICKKYAVCRTRETAVLDKPISRSMAKHLSTLDRKIITNQISDVKYELPEGVKLRLEARRQAASLQK